MNKRKVSIQNNLKAYRQQLGLTQKQVADLIGVNNEERVCHWEKGYNVPSIENLQRLSELYKTSINDFYKSRI